MDKFEMVRFTDDGFELDVRTDLQHDTVWLTQDEMALLFGRNQGVISRHIANIFKEKELDKDTSMQKMHKSNSVPFPNNRPPVYFNLDVVISVGYRVKSQRGVAFRKWALKILKDYLIKGYVVNEKRLE